MDLLKQNLGTGDPFANNLLRKSKEIVLLNTAGLGHHGRDILSDGEQVCRGPYTVRTLRSASEGPSSSRVPPAPGSPFQ